MSPSIITVGPQAALTIPESASNEDSAADSSFLMDSEVNEATELPVPSQGSEEGEDQPSESAGGSITETDDTVKDDDDDSSTFNFPRYIPKGKPNLPTGSAKPKPPPGSTKH